MLVQVHTECGRTISKKTSTELVDRRCQLAQRLPRCQATLRRNTERWFDNCEVQAGPWEWKHAYQKTSNESGKKMVEFHGFFQVFGSTDLFSDKFRKSRKIPCGLEDIIDLFRNEKYPWTSVLEIGAGHGHTTAATCRKEEKRKEARCVHTWRALDAMKSIEKYETVEAKTLKKDSIPQYPTIAWTRRVLSCQSSVLS